MTRNGPVVLSRSSEDVVQLARLLGHADVTIYPSRTGSKWFADCACGWRSTGSVRQVEALGQGRYHLSKAVRDMDTFGRSHGLSPSQALSECALSDQELEHLDWVVSERMQHRERVESA